MNGLPAPSDSVGALLRHFDDLREGSHAGAYTRESKERAYEHAMCLLDPIAREALETFNRYLLLGSGAVTATPLTRDRQGGLVIEWRLSWPAQRRIDSAPARLIAYYGAGFHHPHLRGGTVRDWPLNIYQSDHAAAIRPTLEAILAAEFHNLVYLSDVAIIPQSGDGVALS